MERDGDVGLAPWVGKRDGVAGGGGAVCRV